tara:strand:+ start:791 stop:1012 length:222 start_codon:yes stop_codon:yes gene_type:complete
MKKLTLLVLILGIFTSCVDSLENTNSSGEKVYVAGRTINEVMYDGCTYIYMSGSEQFGITHKGNCKSKVHYKN